MQRIRQVAPSVHEMLLLSPIVISQVEPPPQSMLHDEPHEPLHSFSSEQSSVQLLPSHEVPSVEQAAPGSQAHDVPVQVGAAVSLPQATRNDVNSAIKTSLMRSPGQGRWTRPLDEPAAWHPPALQSPAAVIAPAIGTVSGHWLAATRTG